MPLAEHWILLTTHIHTHPPKMSTPSQRRSKANTRRARGRECYVRTFSDEDLSVAQREEESGGAALELLARPVQRVFGRRGSEGVRI